MDRRGFINQLVSMYLGPTALETREAWKKVNHIDSPKVYYNRVAFRLQNMNLLLLELKEHVMRHALPTKPIVVLLVLEAKDLTKEIEDLRRYYR